jgi:HEAT repeat protein
MDQNGERLPEAEAANVNRSRRHANVVRGLIATFACVGVILWALRMVWEHRDPDLAEARKIQAAALAALQSHKATDRVAAIRDLERLRFADSAIAIRPLTAQLRDEDLEVRTAAVEAVGELGAKAVRNGSDGDAVRAAVKALIGLLKDSHPLVRIAAADALGSITAANPGAGARLATGPLARGGNKVASTPAAADATAVDTNAVIAALAETLGDREAKVRRAAIVGVAASGSPDDPPRAIAAGLEDESAENRVETVRALARFRRGLDWWIPSLLRIAEHDHDRSVREVCQNALTGIEPRAVTAASVPVLIAGLASADPRVRMAVAELLGRVGPDAGAAVPALLRVLTEPFDEEGTASEGEKANLAWAAALALGGIAPRSASTEMVSTALTELARSGHRVRQAPAAWALSDFGPAAAPAIPILIQMVREASANHAAASAVPSEGHATREESAARTLGLIAPGTPAADEVVSALVAALDSDRASTRVATIEALKRFGPKAAIALPKIRALRDDPDFHVKRVVEPALRAIEE